MASSSSDENKISRSFGIFVCVIIPLGIAIMIGQHLQTRARNAESTRIVKELSDARNVLELAEVHQEPFRSKTLKATFNSIFSNLKVLDRLLPERETRIHAWSHMLLLQLAGELGDYDTAQLHFRKAIEIHKSIVCGEDNFVCPHYEFFGWERDGIFDKFYSRTRYPRGNDFWLLCYEKSAEYFKKEGALARSVGKRKEIVAFARKYGGIGEHLGVALRNYAEALRENGQDKVAAKVEKEYKQIWKIVLLRRENARNLNRW